MGWTEERRTTSFQCSVKQTLFCMKPDEKNRKNVSSCVTWSRKTYSSDKHYFVSPQKLLFYLPFSCQFQVHFPSFALNLRLLLPYFLLLSSFEHFLKMIHKGNVSDFRQEIRRQGKRWRRLYEGAVSGCSDWDKKRPAFRVVVHIVTSSERKGRGNAELEKRKLGERICCCRYLWRARESFVFVNKLKSAGFQWRKRRKIKITTGFSWNTRGEKRKKKRERILNTGSPITPGTRNEQVFTSHQHFSPFPLSITMMYEKLAFMAKSRTSICRVTWTVAKTEAAFPEWLLLEVCYLALLHSTLNFIIPFYLKCVRVNTSVFEEF